MCLLVFSLAYDTHNTYIIKDLSKFNRYLGRKIFCEKNSLPSFFISRKTKFPNLPIFKNCKNFKDSLSGFPGKSYPLFRVSGVITDISWVFISGSWVSLSFLGLLRPYSHIAHFQHIKGGLSGNPG